EALLRLRCAEAGRRLRRAVSLLDRRRTEAARLRLLRRRRSVDRGLRTPAVALRRELRRVEAAGRPVAPLLRRAEALRRIRLLLSTARGRLRRLTIHRCATRIAEFVRRVRDCAALRAGAHRIIAFHAPRASERRAGGAYRIGRKSVESTAFLLPDAAPVPCAW